MNIVNDDADVNQAMWRVSRPRAWLHRLRGDIHRKSNRLVQALPDYERTVELEPKAYYVFKRIGAIQFHQGHYDQALANIAKAVEGKPADTSSLLWIGVAEIARCPDPSFREGLLALANHMVELNGHSPDSLSTRAQLLFALGDWQRAWNDLDAAIANKAVGCYTLYQAALIALADDDLAKYRELSRRMLAQFAESEPSEEASFSAWTCALAPGALADYSPALKLAERAVAADPENQLALCGLGAVQMRAGDSKSALASLNKAAHDKDNKNTSIAYTAYLRAMVECKLDRADDARRSLDQANELARQELADEAHPVRWNRKLTLELLRKEAEMLVGNAEAAANDDENSDQDRPESQSELELEPSTEG